MDTNKQSTVLNESNGNFQQEREERNEDAMPVDSNTVENTQDLSGALGNTNRRSNYENNFLNESENAKTPETKSEDTNENRAGAYLDVLSDENTRPKTLETALEARTITRDRVRQEYFSPERDRTETGPQKGQLYIYDGKDFLPLDRIRQFEQNDDTNNQTGPPYGSVGYGRVYGPRDYKPVTEDDTSSTDADDDEEDDRKDPIQVGSKLSNVNTLNINISLNLADLVGVSLPRKQKKQRAKSKHSGPKKTSTRGTLLSETHTHTQRRERMNSHTEMSSQAPSASETPSLPKRPPRNRERTGSNKGMGAKAHSSDKVQLPKRISDEGNVFDSEMSATHENVLPMPGRIPPKSESVRRYLEAYQGKEQTGGKARRTTVAGHEYYDTADFGKSEYESISPDSEKRMHRGLSCPLTIHTSVEESDNYSLIQFQDDDEHHVEGAKEHSSEALTQTEAPLIVTVLPQHPTDVSEPDTLHEHVDPYRECPDVGRDVERLAGRNFPWFYQLKHALTARDFLKDKPDGTFAVIAESVEVKISHPFTLLVAHKGQIREIPILRTCSGRYKKSKFTLFDKCKDKVEELVEIFFKKELPAIGIRLVKSKNESKLDVVVDDMEEAIYEDSRYCGI